MIDTKKANDDRIARERSIVRGMIRALVAGGWAPHSVYDGGERVKTPNESTMMDAITSVDESTAYFRHPNAEKRCCVVIVLGNDTDVIADHSCPEIDPGKFGELMDGYAEKLNKRYF